jgi:hypothetical protein
LMAEGLLDEAVEVDEEVEEMLDQFHGLPAAAVSTVGQYSIVARRRAATYHDRPA